LRDEKSRSGGKSSVRDPGAATEMMSDGDVATLRRKFPFLADFSDEFIRTRPTEALLKMETTSIKMRELERGRDADEKLCSNKMTLEETITAVMAGVDNRTSQLHTGRYLAGAACSTKRQWLKARQVIGLTGQPPIGSYDLASVGLAGYVTSRGWVELHNPSSTKIKLQHFSINNCSAKIGRSGKDGDSRDSDILELAEFKLALRALRTAANFVRNWDFSFLALEGFLLQTNFCEKDIGSLEHRAMVLTKFVNYVLGQNADHWRDSEGFLSTGELSTHWASFIGAMPQSSKQKQKTEKKPSSGGDKHDSTKRKWLDICFAWNNGVCIKAAADCKSSRGTPLRHVCNYAADKSKPDQVCGKDHARMSFHK
jgi:hypothetical protein